MSIWEKYKIIGKFGTQLKRKFGHINLIEDKLSGEIYILKSLPKNTKTEVIENQLRYEADFNFTFPGLPDKQIIYETEEDIQLIRPFIDGLTLDIYWNSLRSRNRLKFIKTFLEKLSPIFGHLEERGIVHCDIKPTNIIICERANDFDVHLIDFGLAINRKEKEIRPTLFPLGYAAPELLLNQLDIVDQTTDLYALGILIWRLYTGKLPLTHPNPSIFTNLQLTHPLPENSDLPRRIYPILLKMTSKHQFSLPPNKMKIEEVRTSLKNAMLKRYTSIEEVLEDLYRIPKPFYQRISFR